MRGVRGVQGVQGVQEYKEYKECDEVAEEKSIFCPDKLPSRSVLMRIGLLKVRYSRFLYSLYSPYVLAKQRGEKLSPRRLMSGFLFRDIGVFCCLD
jgi:hypothetical protein